MLEVHVDASLLVKIVLLSPTTINSESVSLYDTPFKLLVVPDVSTDQVEASLLVTIVPFSPTATYVPLAYITSTKFSLVPDVCSVFVSAPVVLVNI